MFLYCIPDVMGFVEKFYRYHTASLEVKSVTQAAAARATNPALDQPPYMELPGGFEALLKTTIELTLFDFFTAFVPPTANSSHSLDFLLGGRALEGNLADHIFRWAGPGKDWVKQEHEGLQWWRADSPHGPIYTGHEGNWMFVASDPSILLPTLKAIREGLGLERSLAENEAFERNRSLTLTDGALLWVYANVPALAKLPQPDGSPSPLALLYAEQFPALSAVSWGWHSNGPGGPGHDLVAYTLDRETVERGQRIFPELDFNFAQASDELLSVGAISLNPETATEAPVLSGAHFLSHFFPTLPGEQSTLSRRVWKDRSPAEEWSVTGQESASADTNPVAEDTGWLARAGRLPGVKEPFLEWRLNYLGIMEKARAEVLTPEWHAFWTERGVPPPDADVDLAKYFGEVRVTVGFHDDHLLFINAIDLQKLGNTLFSSCVAVTAWIWPDQFGEAMREASRSITAPAAEGNPPWQNAFQIGFASGYFQSPIYTHAHGSTPLPTLMCVDFLSLPLPPPPSTTSDHSTVD